MWGVFRRLVRTKAAPLTMVNQSQGRAKRESNNDCSTPNKSLLWIEQARRVEIKDKLQESAEL